MPWNRPEPDPIKARRRQLADQEKLLAERMARLTHQLHDGSATKPKKASEPPVWRMEDEAQKSAASDPISGAPRVLARQRRRDKVIFFLCIALLLVLVLIVAWFWNHVHAVGG
jgi:hypothetical protein